MVNFETETSQFLGDNDLKASWILGVLKPQMISQLVC